MPPVTQAQPPLEFIPPAFDSLVFRLVRLILPFYRKWGVRLPQVQVENVETLAQLYQQFQQGKVRFLIAFRHPSTNDPICLAHVLWNCVPAAARQKGIALNGSPTHVHFMYDRGIPLWAGQAVGWLYSRLGGTPIRRGKVDLMGLRSIRSLFANGHFPMAAAPEGATNGHNEIVSPIEPGIAQFGFWCLEDLQKEGRSLPVVILPVGIQYHFADSPWQSIEALLRQLEADSGVPTDPAHLLTLQNGVPLTPEEETILYQRLFRLGEHLLSLMEEFYRKFYKQPIPVLTPETTPDRANEQLAARLQTLMNAALTVAEQYFDLTPKGTITDRCRRLEQAGWDRIYREDIKQLETLAPFGRGLADRVAEEADLRLWHMRVVESFVSVTGCYVRQKPTIERFAETLSIIWETIARITDKPAFPRPQLGQQRVQITVGSPLSVSDRWSDYQSNRRQAVATLTQDLQTALEQMIR